VANTELGAVITSLQKSENRFRQVVENAPNAMIMVNATGLIELVNTQAERLFGYDRQDLIGHSIEILVPVRYRSDHPGMRVSFFDHPQSRPMGAGRDLYALHKEGHEFPVEIGLNPLEWDDGPRVLAAVIDLTDRVNREASLKTALHEKDVYFQEIHHRVKNNLQVIDSILDLQSLNVTDAFALEVIRDCRNRIRSMALIHQHLYSSKQFSQVDVGGVLSSLAPTLFTSYGLSADRVRLKVDMDNVPMSMNAAIPCGLFMNEVISNALKHAFPDDREGTITVRLSWDGGNVAELSVTDDGVGLPPDMDVATGLTLGLQLIGSLADQLHGELSVNSRNPTEFRLRIPLEP
jgi:PAS domain S-box-containing protein